MESDAAVAGVSTHSVGPSSGVGQVTTPAGNQAIELEKKYAGVSCIEW